MDKPEMTVEQFKSKLEAAETKAAEAAQTAQELKAKLEASDAGRKTAAESVKSATDAIEKLNTEFEAFKLGNKGGEEPEQTLADAIETALKSDSFKMGKTIEVKASTSDVVTPFTNAHVLAGVNMPRQRELAFMPHFTLRNVPKDKDVIVYMEGQYASNVDYVSEGSGNGTEDTVNAVEKTRKLAKISAKIKVTTEMFEDKSYVADQLQNEMRRKAMLWFDSELLSGAGNDTTAPNKIYGLKTHATAFSVAKAGVGASIDSPTVSDLAESVKLQGVVQDKTNAAKTDEAGFGIDTLFINPIDAMKWRSSKDKNGQYLLTRLADGSQIMGGLRVVETKAIACGAMMGIESGIAELWMKRNFEIKVGQEGTDLTDDMFTIVLFMRGQTLIKDINKEGVIFVPDVTAALAALAKPTV